MLLETAAGLEIIDYKTDAVTVETVAARVDFYRRQMSLYREGVHAATGQPVVAVHLVFLAARHVERLV